MALERIHLRKLLKLFFLEPAKLRSEIKDDIRTDRARAAGTDPSGGDFYSPFWADAKHHVFGALDLHGAVDQRIDANRYRRHLYPRLRDGFLLWWNERRRWTNQPFTRGESQKARFAFPGLAATVKVEDVLSARDAGGQERFVYPYFSQSPVLSEQAARLGLWLLTTALPKVPPDAIRILDVIRGQTYSLDRNPLTGNEEEDFRSRYTELLRQRDLLRREDE